MNKEIKDLIADYANVYRRFEAFQKGDNSESILSGGDQKTGVIAEYYAKLYIEKTFCNGQPIGYQNPGDTHDLQYQVNGKKDPVKVQVKAVSAHSQTRTISPIKLHDKFGDPAFDQLYLISLNLDFRPDGLWINGYDSIIGAINSTEKVKKSKIEGAFMKGTSASGKVSMGSATYLNFDDDLKEKLLEAIG